MATWGEVSGSAEFKALNTADREAVRQDFFNRVIAPEAGADVDAIKSDFLARTASSVKEQGLLDKASSVYDRAVGATTDLIEWGANKAKSVAEARARQDASEITARGNAASSRAVNMQQFGIGGDGLRKVQVDPEHDISGRDYEYQNKPVRESIAARDVPLAFVKGGYGLVDAAGKGMRMAGLEEAGRSVQNVAQDRGDMAEALMSPAGRAASKSEIVRDDTLRFGDTPIQSSIMSSAQSLSSMMATMAIAGPVGKAITPYVQTALKPLAAHPGFIGRIAGFLSNTAPTAITAGAAEGAITALQNSAEAERRVMDLPSAKLSQSPKYAELMAQTDPSLQPQEREAQVRTAIAKLVSDEVARDTLISTGGIGILTGGGVAGATLRYKPGLGGIKDRLVAGAKGTAAGVAEEYPQEVLQSGGEKLVENMAWKKYVDPSTDVGKGVIGAGLSGGISAVGMGGGMGGVRGLASMRDRLDAGSAPPMPASDVLGKPSEPMPASDVLGRPDAPAQGAAPADTAPVQTEQASDALPPSNLTNTIEKVQAETEAIAVKQLADTLKEMQPDVDKLFSDAKKAGLAQGKSERQASLEAEAVAIEAEKQHKQDVKALAQRIGELEGNIGTIWGGVTARPAIMDTVEAAKAAAEKMGGKVAKGAPAAQETSQPAAKPPAVEAQTPDSLHEQLADAVKAKRIPLEVYDKAASDLVAGRQEEARRVLAALNPVESSATLDANDTEPTTNAGATGVTPATDPGASAGGAQAVPDNAVAGNAPPGAGLAARLQSRGETNAAAVAAFIAQRLGVRINWLNDGSDKAPDGWFNPADPDTVNINAGSDRAVIAVFGHEILHLLKNRNPEVYNKLIARIKPMLRDIPTYKAWMEANYKKRGLTVSDETLTAHTIEEIAADLLGDFMASPSFWRDLFKDQSTSWVNQIKNVILRMLDAISLRLRLRSAGEGFASQVWVKGGMDGLAQVRSALMDGFKEWEAAAASVNAAADAAAMSPNNDLSEPTELQKANGNYKKGHARIAGMDIAIENPKGSKRNPKWPTLKSHYGYIKGTTGKDGDHIDVFIKDGLSGDYSGPVFVIDQQNEDGSFDEHKVMLGWTKQDAAEKAYLSNYTKGWNRIGGIRAFENTKMFREWLKSGDTKQPATTTMYSFKGRPSIQETIENFDQTDPYSLDFSGEPEGMSVQDLTPNQLSAVNNVMALGKYKSAQAVLDDYGYADANDYVNLADTLEDEAKAELDFTESQITKDVEEVSTIVDLDKVEEYLAIHPEALGSTAPTVKRDKEISEMSKEERSIYNKGLHKIRQWLWARTATKKFKKWFGNSEIRGGEGNLPRIFFRGDPKGNLEEFKSGTYGKGIKGIGPNDTEDWVVIFASPSPHFAHDYTHSSLPSFKTIPSMERMASQKVHEKADINKIYPVFVRAENPWDFENPKHIEAVAAELWKQGLMQAHKDFTANAPFGSWTTIEEKKVQKIIRSLGHDSFYVQEHGVKNIGVYSKNQMKSAIANMGEYSREDDRLRFSMGDRPVPNDAKEIASLSVKYVAAQNKSLESVASIERQGQDDKRFAEFFSKAVAADDGVTAPIPMMQNPSVLRLFKVPNQMMTMAVSIAKKIVNKHGGDFTVSTPEQLSSLIRDPLMVFKGRGKDEFDLVLDATNSEGKPLMVAVKANTPLGQEKMNPAMATVVMTAYAKPWRGSGDSIENRLKTDGALLYVEKGKAPQAFQRVQAQFLNKVLLAARLRSQNVKDWPDVVKFNADNSKDANNLVPMYSAKDRPQIDTPEFKRWFGDSKVVDAGGKPLVVYHGGTKGIEAFDPSKVGANFGYDAEGFFFTTERGDYPGTADNYAGLEGEVYPVYLALQNPYTLEQFAKDLGLKVPELVVQQGSPQSPITVFDTDRNEVMRRAKEGGYDGVSFQVDYGDGTNEGMFVAFSPTQIKSAIGNNGHFDANNPDIRYSDRGRPLRERMGLPSAAAYEIAPDPNNKVAAGAWDDLSGDAQASITYAVDAQITPEIERATGMSKVVYTKTFGGYLKSTNPSVFAKVPGNVPVETLRGFMKALGFVYNQDSVIATIPEPYVGATEDESSIPSDSITIELDRDLDYNIAKAIYDAIRTDSPWVQGFTGQGRQIQVINVGGKITPEMREVVRQSLDGVDVDANAIVREPIPVHVLFVARGEYEGNAREGAGERPIYGSNEIRKLRDLRATAAARVAEEVAAAKEKGEVKLSASGRPITMLSLKERIAKTGSVAASAAAVATKPLNLANRIADLGTKVPGKVVAAITSPLYDRLVNWGGNFMNGGEIRQKIAHGLKADYGLPEPYIDARNDREISINKVLRKSKEMVDRIASLDRAEARIAYLWMQEKPNSVEEQALMNALPVDSRATLAEMKQQIDQLGQEAVNLGLLSQDSYNRNHMAYLHRTYQKHELENPNAVARGQQSKAIRAEAYKGRGLRDDVAASQFPNAKVGDKFTRLEKRNASGSLQNVAYVPVGQAIPPKYSGWTRDGEWEYRFNDRLQKHGEIGMWRDLTAQERGRLGEIDEVRYAFARTMIATVRDIETARFLDWVASNYAKSATDVKAMGGTIKDAVDSMITLSTYTDNDWVQVPSGDVQGTSIKKYGNLAGRYIPGHIWNDIRAVINMRANDEIWRLYDSMLKAWKISKTALSPAVHMNNVMSNFILADLADVGPDQIRKALKTILDAQGGDAAAKAMMDRFYDSGSELGSQAQVELRGEHIEPLLKELENQQNGVVGQISTMQAISLIAHGNIRDGANALASKKGTQIAALPFKKLIELYRNEDAVFRFAKWKQEVDAGKSDRDAGKEARAAFLDYQINAPWIQMARRGPLPFLAFSYRAIPLLIESAAKKPWKAMKYFAIGSALNAVAYAMLGADGDEEKERKLLPQEKSGKALGIFPRMFRMPWNDQHGSPVFMDVRRWIPGGDIVDLNGSQSAIPLPQWLSVGGPVSLFTEMVSNKSLFTGKPIVLKTDTAAEAAAKVTDHLFKFFAPNMPIPNPVGYWMDSATDQRGLFQTYSWKSIKSAGSGETDAFGRERDLRQAILGAGGVKIGSYAEDAQTVRMKFERGAKERELNEQKAQINRMLQRNAITPEEHAKMIDKLQSKREKIIKEFGEKVD